MATREAPGQTVGALGASAPAVRAVTGGPRHHFFGYYDKRPWDAHGGRLLVHEVGFNHRPPRADDEAVVGVVDLARQNRFTPIGRTRAWNFQQGVMLQWLGPDFERRVVYNRRDGDAFVAVVVDVATGEERVLDRPVAALSRDGSLGLSLNFARLADVRPGYGYAGGVDPWAGVPTPEEDGIHLIDFAGGASRLVVSIAEVARFGGSQAPRGAKHWINHLLFNPDGTRFCFLHRWRGEDGAINSRLFTVRPDGSDLFCLSDGGMVSHFDWRNERQLLGWARVKKGAAGGRGGAKLVRLAGLPWFKRPPLSWALHLARRSGVVGWTRQRVVGDRFILFTDGTEQTAPVGLGQLAEDGHCSYSPDGRWILMDTYPHEDHMRALLLYDTREGRRIDLGRFYSLPDLPDEIRCDLHARWDRAGRRACIDSTHAGTRQVYIVKLGDAIAS